MDKQNFRVTYMAPRYHTNQVPVMRGWRDAGVEVQFLAQYQGVGEVHDGVKFYQLHPSLLTRVWHRIIEKNMMQ